MRLVRADRHHRDWSEQILLRLVTTNTKHFQSLVADMCADMHSEHEASTGKGVEACAPQSMHHYLRIAVGVRLPLEDLGDLVPCEPLIGPRPSYVCQFLKVKFHHGSVLHVFTLICSLESY